MEKEKQKTERKEHILVCLSFSPSNEKIIRTAAQMARAFGANFTALYVQTAEPAEKTPEDQARLQKHIRLAEQSGAEIVTTHSEDIALQIAEYARISEVTRIVIGKSMMDQGFFSKEKGMDRTADRSGAGFGNPYHSGFQYHYHISGRRYDDVHSDQRLYLQRNQFCDQCSAV